MAQFASRAVNALNSVTSGGSAVPENIPQLVGFKVLPGSPIPFINPNVVENGGPSEAEQIATIINGVESSGDSCGTTLCTALCCLSIVGGVYMCCKQVVVNDGYYGFSNDNSRYKIILPGRHLLLSPLHNFIDSYPAGNLEIYVEGTIAIIRVLQGSLGMARNGADQEILLPGLHVRIEPKFKFEKFYYLDNKEPFIFDTIKFFTVNTGEVRVAYDQGRVITFKEGRYLVNSAGFMLAGVISMQQQNLRLQKHPVLLDGGVSMLIEGLLTFQVCNVEKLITELGDSEINRVIEDITKAELSRVFSSVHLEQLSEMSRAQLEEAKAQKSASSSPASATDGGAVQQSGTRHAICDQVQRYIKEYADSWGVAIINFQLESTRLQDAKYAQDYEEASLALAKAKANQRAVVTESQIRLTKAHAQADQLKIEAEGRAKTIEIEAKAAAQARTIEAEARNLAGEAMTDDFARKYALQSLQVEFAKNLQAQVLTVLPDSSIGRPMGNSMLASLKH